MRRDYQLLNVLQSYAPNIAAQELVFRIYNKMKKDKLTLVRREREILNMLYRGLEKDIWPWTDYYKPY